MYEYLITNVMPDFCGFYDTEEFIASELCCACPKNDNEKQTSYTIDTRFIWNCKIMEWADDKLRVVYSISDSFKSRLIG